MGKRVAFSIEGGNRNIEGELVEVNDRGIVIAFTGRESTPRTLFYPWRNGNPAADFWTYALSRFEHCKILMRSAEFEHSLNVLRTSYQRASYLYKKTIKGTDERKEL